MKTEQIPHAEIEAKWRKRWQEAELFKAPDVPRPGKKFYCLDMFPYPSADGLHVGHPEGYTATDILCRYKRRQGFDVLHPMGWDAFGLPAENFALQTGTHPRIVTHKNIGNFKRQIQSLGFSYDWSREVDTTDPEYYRWTQWIFLQLHKKGLAYEGTIPINWCPSCKTGLANEEVFGGACERCGTPVEKRDVRQWLLKITAYAERLLADLGGLDWPESTLSMQRNWIGRSEGAQVMFTIHAPGLKAHGKMLEVFTTRPDTLYGATYMVLAPEHTLVPELTSPEHKSAVETYVKAARIKTDMERSALEKKKTGEFTGAHAVNPVNGETIPIWIADYVLAGYGTGAIMAVPAHDERDFEFAHQFKLPIVEVVRAPDDWSKTKAFCGDGIAVNSLPIDGLPTSQAKVKMIEYLEKKGLGHRKTAYKLRDWVFSRQRYWGEPIPIVHCNTCGAVPVPESELPVVLPDVKDYKPTGTGESPLAAIADWVNTKCPKCGGPGRRETNTMPQWAGSCWYYLRFLDPKNKNRAWDKTKESAWMPVDCYVGGSEHAVLHLLYARFWHKVLYDLGFVSTPEPFQKLRHQGMILSYSYRDARGNYHPYSDMDFGEDGKAALKAGGETIEPLVEKMSKSKKNVINPDEVINRYGADVFRMYEMFMGPFEDSKPWDMRSIEGIARFLRRVWNQFTDIPSPHPLPHGGEGNSMSPSPSKGEGRGEGGVVHLRHRTIAKVGADIENLHFNTAISALMIYLNELQSQGTAQTQKEKNSTGGSEFRWLHRADAETFLNLLNPFAPYLTEELWEKTGHSGFLSARPWPSFDERFLKEDRVELAVQINGKVRERLMADAGSPEEQIRKSALELPKIRETIDGRQVVKVIIVQDNLVNIVVK